MYLGWMIEGERMMRIDHCVGVNEVKLCIGRRRNVIGD